MITPVQLQTIFKWPSSGSRQRASIIYHDMIRKNYKELLEIGHHLWQSPIHHICHLIMVIDGLNTTVNRIGILHYSYYVNLIPVVSESSLEADLMKLEKYCHKKINEVITHDIADMIMTASMTLTEADILKYKTQTLNILYDCLIHLRYFLAPEIISEASKNIRSQSVPMYDHPIYKLYKDEDINAGEVNNKLIGDGQDLYNPKSLVSTNDIAGLLIKLKSIYMKAAYLQLIQTLSQLAERKSYQTITFRQDELRGVLDQIKKLSNDTYRQLMAEDKLISKLCFNIVKIIDPSIPEKEFIEAITLDVGKYSSNNYSLVNKSYT